MIDKETREFLQLLVISDFLGREIKKLNWDILMECVTKIEKLSLPDNLEYCVTISKNGCRITRNWTTSKIRDFGWHQTGDKFSSTKNSILEFINYFKHNNFINSNKFHTFTKIIKPNNNNNI